MCDVYLAAMASLNKAIDQACIEQPGQMQLAAENSFELGAVFC